MNCETVLPLLAQYSEALLDESQLQLVEQHLETCASCRHASRLERLQQQRYQRLIQALPVPEPGPGRLAYMLKQATEETAVASDATDKTSSRFWQFATVASLLLAVLVSPIKLFDKAPEAFSQAREVAVAINVPRAMPRVALALDFPDDLRWQGLENQKRVTWTVDLKSGRNILTLPLVVSEGGPALQAGRSTITATVAYQDGLRQFQLPVVLADGQARPVSM